MFVCYRSTITREKFEELCEDLWELALTPVKEVLAHSDMKIDDIYAVELIGGATRVPKLQVNKFVYILDFNLSSVLHCGGFQKNLKRLFFFDVWIL